MERHPQQTEPIRRSISTTVVVSAHEAFVEPVQLFFVIKFQDQLTRTALRRHLYGHARPDVPLQLVDRGLTIGVNRLALGALHLAAGPPSRHSFDLPDGEFPA